VFVVSGEKRQLNEELVTHEHTASLGVGGRVEEARNVEFSCGNLGKFVCPELDCVGVLIKVTLLYCAIRRVKSSFGVAVLASAEILTKLKPATVASK